MGVTIVKSLSEAGSHLRLDAKFHQPQYFIDFSRGNWKPIKKFIDTCQYGISQAMVKEPIGHPIFRMDDIKDCFLLNDEVKYIKIPEDIFRQFRLKTNDILFNRVNAEEFVGRTGIFKLKGDYVFASYLIRLRVKPNSQILPDYLNIFLNTSFGIRQIRKFFRRAVNQANVNAKELKNFRIAVIPLGVQREVSQLSNKAWNKIELSKSLYTQAENLLLKETGLKGFEPKFKLSYTSSLSKAFGASRIDAEHFQPVYDEVIQKILGFENGYTQLLGCVENVNPNFDPTKYPDKTFSYVELADVNASIGVIHSVSEVKGKEAPNRARRILKEDDVIVSSVEGSLEKVALVSKELKGSLASTGFFQLRPKTILPEVLLVLSKSIIMQAQLKRECAGSILTAVSDKSLRKILVPILSNSSQQKIALLVQQSHRERKEARRLLEEAKRKVEEAISLSSLPIQLPLRF